MPPTIEVRNATEKDREAVFDFCKSTWEWGDYIPSVWEAWLRFGDTLVAAFDEEPIAVLHLQYNNSEAWLEGLRVSGRFRKSGVGTRLVQESVNRVKGRGKSVLRLAVDLNNLPSRNLFSKFGFQEEFRFYDLEKDAIPSHGKSGAFEVRSEHVSEAWRYIKRSRELKSSKGLYACWWRWWNLTSSEFEGLVEKGQCLLHRNRNTIDGLLVFQIYRTKSGGLSCQIRYMHGTDAALSPLLGKLVEINSKEQIQYYFSLVPENSNNLRFLQSLNFSGRWRFAVMSLSLVPIRYP